MQSILATVEEKIGAHPRPVLADGLTAFEFKREHGALHNALRELANLWPTAKTHSLQSAFGDVIVLTAEEGAPTDVFESLMRALIARTARER